MYCNSCGAQQPDDTKFCTSCGSQLFQGDPAADQPAEQSGAPEGNFPQQPGGAQQGGYTPPTPPGGYYAGQPQNPQPPYPNYGYPPYPQQPPPVDTAAGKPYIVAGWVLLVISFFMPLFLGYLTLGVGIVMGVTSYKYSKLNGGLIIALNSIVLLLALIGARLM